MSNICFVEIAESARKHWGRRRGHAARRPRSDRRIERDDDAILIIGANRAGRLLEVVVVDREGEQRVIHAMTMRPAFRRYRR